MDISSTIFDISIQLNKYRYCITRLMYHDMAIYRYTVESLVSTDSSRGIINIIEQSVDLLCTNEYTRVSALLKTFILFDGTWYNHYISL